MEITVDELNTLLQKEFERGRSVRIIDSVSGFSSIPSYTIDNDPCKACPNNPANGGSGICHCILGNRITYSANTETIS